MLAFLCVCLISNTAAAQLLTIYDGTTSHRLDPNGFIFSPRWLNEKDSTRPDIRERCRFRVDAGELGRRTLNVTQPDCLSPAERPLVSLNETGATLAVGFECGTGGLYGNVRGHVNWFPMTAAGRLRWVGYSKDPGDHDLTFAFTTPYPNAETSGNLEKPGKAGYHLEFYRDETLARLPTSGQSWWHALNDAMRITDKNWYERRNLPGVMLDDSTKKHNGSQLVGVSIMDHTAKNMVDGHFAIVTGLFNLDAVHHVQAELHPVYAITVLIDTATSESGKLAERWAVMVRDRGNEGDCASGVIPMFTHDPDSIRNHALRNQHFVFDLGGWAGAANPTVSVEKFWSTHPDARPRVRNTGQNIYVDFPHLTPIIGNDDFLFLGTLKVEWQRRGVMPYERERFKEYLGPNGGFTMGPRSGPVDSASQALTNYRERLNQIEAAKARRRGKDVVLFSRLKPGNTELPLDSIDPGWKSREHGIPLVYKAWQWPTGDTTVAVNCSEGKKKSHFICGTGKEYVFRSSYAPSSHSWLPMIGIRINPHTWVAPKRIAWVSDVLGGAAWRFEGGWDAFRREREGRDQILAGPTARLTAILAPNSRRLNSTVVFTPYVGVSGGGSLLWDKHAKDSPKLGGLTGGSGVGTQLDFERVKYVGSMGVFGELMRYTNTRKMESQHLFSIGVSKPATQW